MLVRIVRLCIVGVVMLLSSCTSVKQFSYFQDMREGDGKVEMTEASMIRVKPQDKMYILVSGKDSRLTMPFNIETTSSSSSTRSVGYVVDDEGNIDFPGLGLIAVNGLTRNEIALKIKNTLIERQLVKEPIVYVEFMNFAFTVLGDVGSPGRYNIEKDQITIIEAIGMAGDLTVTGKRNNILVLREENGVQKSYTVDMTSASQMMSSPVYYLQQNDVIYVEPNKVKANQSTINGNTVGNVSFWMSAVSFVTSLALIFVNLK